MLVVGIELGFTEVVLELGEIKMGKRVSFLGNNF